MPTRVRCKEGVADLGVGTLIGPVGCRHFYDLGVGRNECRSESRDPQSGHPVSDGGGVRISNLGIVRGWGPPHLSSHAIEVRHFHPGVKSQADESQATLNTIWGPLLATKRQNCQDFRHKTADFEGRF